VQELRGCWKSFTVGYVSETKGAAVANARLRRMPNCRVERDVLCMTAKRKELLLAKAVLRLPRRRGSAVISQSVLESASL